jgi:hypothetical protein
MWGHTTDKMKFQTMKPKLILCLALVLGGAIIVPNCNAGIVYPKAPDGGEQAVSNLLDSKYLKPLLHLPPAKYLTIARPFPVYFYPIKYTNLFSGQLLSETKFAGWRYLVTYGTNSAELQLPYDEEKREWPEIGWQFYPALPSGCDPVLKTLQAAERLPQVKKADYELRYLNFLDIQFFAVWLHGKSSDIIIPVPIYGNWQDYRPYSEREMIELLKREIENKMKEPAYKGVGFPVD